MIAYVMHISSVYVFIYVRQLSRFLIEAYSERFTESVNLCSRSEQAVSAL